ncbi:MAG TPA: hypothetical protein VK453_26340 [Micromonosporaceae bacterium]|nr:hypothetical protein [Micromonosporaceae bacterium]
MDQGSRRCDETEAIVDGYEGRHTAGPMVCDVVQRGTGQIRDRGRERVNRWEPLFCRLPDVSAAGPVEPAESAEGGRQ